MKSTQTRSVVGKKGSSEHLRKGDDEVDSDIFKAWGSILQNAFTNSLPSCLLHRHNDGLEPLGMEHYTTQNKESGRHEFSKLAGLTQFEGCLTRALEKFVNPRKAIFGVMYNPTPKCITARLCATFDKLEMNTSLSAWDRNSALVYPRTQLPCSY